jgi:hypothetical protein
MSLVSLGQGKNLHVASQKIPFEAICVNSESGCRAQGAKLGGYQDYDQDRLHATEADDYSVGNTMDLSNYDGRDPVIDLTMGTDYTVDEQPITYDVAIELFAQASAELKAQLKANKIKGDLQAIVLAEFRKELGKNVHFDIKNIVVTLTTDFITKLNKSSEGDTKIERKYADAQAIIDERGLPVIRQLKILNIETIYTEKSSLETVLKATLEGSLKEQVGAGKVDVSAITNAVLKKKKTRDLVSNYSEMIVYSIGFWQEPWFMDPKPKVKGEWLTMFDVPVRTSIPIDDKQLILDERKTQPKLANRTVSKVEIELEFLPQITFGACPELKPGLCSEFMKSCWKVS